MTIAGIYIHIPFCGKICPFCSFAVIRDDPRKHDLYLSLLHKEMELLRRKLRLNFDRLRSVYLGGGTPSRLSIDELGKLSELLRASFKLNLKSKAQWSIEVNPEDLSPEYARGLKELGFSRVSLGVQSFSDQSLKKLGRAHTGEDSLSTVRILRQSGFKNINLDLMFGCPGQTERSLEADLREFINQDPAHISAYCLNIEPKTAVFRKPEWRRWQEDNEELIVGMSRQIAEKLRSNGFQQYEISNFSKKGLRSPQNLINWRGENYLGIGAGAHSFVAPFRWGNYRRWAEYRKMAQNNHLPWEYHEKLTPGQRRDEKLMLGLRLAEGVDLSELSVELQANAPSLLEKEIQRFEKSNLLQLKNNRLILTPKGMSVADEITVSLACLINR